MCECFRIGSSLTTLVPQVDCARPDAVTLSLILNFCIDRPFGFSAYQDNYFLFNVSNFCLDRPFGFSVHRDAPFCLSRLFRFSTYQVVLLFLGKVFFDCICVHRSRKFITIHSCKSHCTARKSFSYDVRTFIVRRPLAPRVMLERTFLSKTCFILFGYS